ncbi:MAG TPA: ABC transporter ATP-binding protein [Alphaproteobacteria bacterium]
MSAKEPLNVPFKDVMRFMWEYFSRYKKLVVAAYVTITLASTTSLLNPYVYQWLVDVSGRVITGETRSFMDILPPIVAVVLVSIFYHVFTRTAHFINCKTDSRVQAAIAWEVTSKLHTFETEWHANHFVGSMVTAIKRGRSAAHTFFDQLCYEFWPTIYVVFLTVILMFQRSPAIAYFFLAFAVIFTVVSIIVSQKYVLPTNRLYSAEDSKMGGAVADSLTGHTITKSFGAEKREENRLKAASDDLQKSAETAWVRLNIMSLFQNVMLNIGRIGALVMAGWYWSQGEFNAGDMIYVLMSQRVLSDYLDNIGNNLNKVVTAINDMEEVVAWSNRIPKIVSPVDAKMSPIKEGRIEFHKINFAYDEQSKPALIDFSLTINPGEKIALVGPSGGGKSTVLKLLQRFYEAQQGQIIVDGHNIAELDLSSYRAAMALVPQDPVLFHRSLADNIAYAKPDSTIDEIIAAAKSAQIAGLIEHFPKKYDTFVGERGIKLSGGERQRVAIARAILADTPILLLDEATSALDSESEEEIQKGIAEASKGRTMIAIAHRLSTIQSVDRIIVLGHGRILEQGSHRELLGLQGGLYRRLYEAQAKGFLPDHLITE